jgi:hypothetical protein
VALSQIVHSTLRANLNRTLILTSSAVIAHAPSFQPGALFDDPHGSVFSAAATGPAALLSARMTFTKRVA